MLDLLTKISDRHTTALAAATKTEPWKILAQTQKSNK
jgi:hypothetical protein